MRLFLRRCLASVVIAAALIGGAAPAHADAVDSGMGHLSRPLRHRGRPGARYRQQGGQPHRRPGLGDAVRRSRRRPRLLHKIWNWTRDNLQRRDNALFSWRYDPDGKTPVADIERRVRRRHPDRLGAGARSRHWNDPEYGRAARRIVADIRRRLLVRAQGWLVLLPGPAGFKARTASPSSTRPITSTPRSRNLPGILPSPEWQRLRLDGLELLAEARFGRWGLTPDWL